MSIDWEVAKIWFVIIALVAFNLPIALACWKFRNVTGLAEVVQEKDPEGDKTGRETGDVESECGAVARGC